MTALLLLSLLVVALGCAYFSLGLAAWSILSVAALTVFGFYGDIGLPVLLLTGIVLLPIMFILNALPLRRNWLSKPFLKVYKNMIPRLSDTEQVALEAGTVGFEGQLFSGNPDWKQFLAKKTPVVSAEEQAFIDGPAEQLCDMLDEWAITHEHADLSPETWQFIKDNKFFGMIIPKEYGGHGFSAVAHRAVLQKVSGISVSAGSTVSVPNSLGPAELLLQYGTDEQKNYYLPRLAVGKEIPCFGLTAPRAGSDATSIPDTGIICHGEYKGENVLGMRLNFDKRYITLAPVATIIGVAFRLMDPDGLFSDKKDLGISLALIPRDTPGMNVGKQHLPLNVPFQNGPVRGKDVFVPLDALIGGSEMAGQGWRMLVECLSVGRAISIPSNNSGGMKTACLATGAYARIRKQFNISIGRFEGIEEPLARMAGLTYASTALSRMTAIAVNNGEKPAVTSAIAKYHTTENARTVIGHAMDIHGGKGIILGPKNYLGRAWQGSPISITVEGANILTRSLMIFGQGAIRCHPYVLKELQAAAEIDPDIRLREFDKVLFQHIGYSISNAVKSLLLGLSLGSLAKAPVGGPTARYYRKLSRYSAALALGSDVAMLILGGKLKFKEKLSGRFADVLSQLYIGSAMLSRYEDQGRPAEDLPILDWAMQDAIFKTQQAFAGIIDNFPVRPAAWLLRLLVFPLGRWEKTPDDQLGHEVASLLLEPSVTRDRLTAGIYRSARSGHPIGVMEEALPEIIAAEPLELKVNKAVKSGQIEALDYRGQIAEAKKLRVLTAAEAKQLLHAQELVAEIISVDEFDAAELKSALPRKSKQGKKTPHAA